MEITINFGFVNWFAVLAATVAAFLLAGLWFSPVMFGRPGVVDVAKTGGHARSERKIEWIFVGAFLMHWLSASMMAALLGPNATILYGLQVGLLIGLCLVTPAMGITYIFENRRHQFWFANGGYHTVSFALMGTILGAWT
jgi:hypothetical protein